MSYSNRGISASRFIPSERAPQLPLQSARPVLNGVHIGFTISQYCSIRRFRNTVELLRRHQRQLLFCSHRHCARAYSRPKTIRASHHRQHGLWLSQSFRRWWIQPGLIQKPKLDPDEIRKTFTCQIGIGISTTAFVYLLAPWIARQFHDPSAVHVIQAMSLMIAIQSTGLVSAALLRRGMRFKAVQYAALSSYLFGYLLIGIPLATYGAGDWSLVLAYLAQSLLNSALLYWAARHSLVPLFALPDRSITTFGGTIIANNVVNWGHSNLDNIAASSLGPAALGLYGRGCNFAYQPVNTVVNALQSVLYHPQPRFKTIAASCVT